MQPLGAAVFALDGILIGAGDTRFLMWSMLAASAIFITLAALSLALDWGVVGVWVGARRPHRGTARAARPALPQPPLGGSRLGLRLEPMEGLAELHTHLGGSVSSDILWSLAHRQGIALPVKDFWDFDRLVTVSDPRGVPDLDALDAIYH